MVLVGSVATAPSRAGNARQAAKIAEDEALGGRAATAVKNAFYAVVFGSMLARSAASRCNSAWMRPASSSCAHAPSMKCSARTTAVRSVLIYHC